MSTTTTRMVLITDLRESTDLRVRIGDGAFDALRREHDRLLGEAAVAHNGEVVKGSGDGVIVLFGAAHEAIAASVAMQQVIAQLNTRANDELGLAIGISAGDVALEEGDCHGTPVVEAARLCSAAARGEVLVADVLRVLAGTRVTSELVFRGALELKGLPVPVMTYEVRWDPIMSSRPALPDAIVAGPFPFAGRSREREQLRNAWKTARAGTSQLVLVSGEPGIGKTRLVGELARDVYDGDGDVVLFGRCDEDLAVPYEPFLDPLVALLGHSADLVTAQRDTHGGVLARLGAALVPFVGEPPPPDASPEIERQRMFDAAADLLAEAAADRPALLVLDDLHWATAPTLSLLRHVLRRTPTSPLLIVGTYRDTDLARTHPLAATLADLRRDGVGERVALSGLDGDEVTDFLCRAAGEDIGEQGRSLAAAVFAETEGNPFFVGEVLRDLAESGAIAQGDGHWAPTGAVETLALPQGVREVVGRRLSRHSDATNRVLALAAVAGPKFEAATLEQVHEPASEVLDALEAASATGLVTEDPTRIGWFGFTHALVRQTLLAELTATRRARIHQSLARAIEDRYRGAIDAVVPDLATHFGAAAALGEARRAVEYARQAADQSFARLADEEAMVWLERALEADDLDADSDPHQRIDLLGQLGGAHFARGEREAAIVTMLEAARLARAAGDESAFAYAVSSAARSVPFGGGDARVDPLLSEALASAPARSRIRVHLLAAMAGGAIYSARGQDPIALAEEAAEIASEIGDENLRGLTSFGLAYALQCGPDAPRQLAVAEALDTRVFGDAYAFGQTLEGGVWVPFARGFARMRVGDLAGLAADRDRLMEAATAERRLPIFAASAAQWTPLATMLTGPIDDAESQINAVLEITGDEPMFLAGHAIQTWWLRILQGDLDGATAIADLLVAMLPDAMLSAPLYPLVARAEAGDKDGVVAQLAAIDGGPLNMIQPDWTRSATLFHLAQAAYVAGDAALGAAVYELLRAYDGQLMLFVCTHVPGSAAHALGHAAAATGDRAAAISHFEEAIAFEEHVGAPVVAARSRAALAALA